MGIYRFASGNEERKIIQGLMVEHYEMSPISLMSVGKVTKRACDKNSKKKKKKKISKEGGHRAKEKEVFRRMK